jgi:uncharacterized membrane protein YhaH (DUF805 family)
MIKFLFGMQERVERKPYVLWGAGLFVLKYLGELALYYAAMGRILTPLNFVSPLLYQRYPDFGQAPDWFGPAVVLWSIPFIWIGVSMSIRRAADAGLTPWAGLLFFVPALNYLLMAALSFLPSSPKEEWSARAERIENTRLVSPLLLTFVFALAGTLLCYVSTNVFREYGTSLFIGSPLILGLVQGYTLNRASAQSFSRNLGFSALTVLLIHLFLMIFALEGAICLMMSFPISLVLAVMGTALGVGISRYSRAGAMTPVALVLILPAMPWAESAVVAPHSDVVFSSVVIDAPPEKVWPNVVKFSDLLPPTDDWLFKLGVAYPLRARIEGTGAGAVRHCEFSTGAFVEPITAWEEPSRLAFDVRYQPQPMKEVSFYDRVDAPHLDGYFRSKRGEFRLVPAQGGRTILEGRTWYEVDMQPGWYWQVYGRWFIHRIHGRVLAHIKNLTEKPGSL